MESRSSLAVGFKNPHQMPETLEIVSKWPSALSSSNGISPRKWLQRGSSVDTRVAQVLSFTLRSARLDLNLLSELDNPVHGNLKNSAGFCA